LRQKYAVGDPDRQGRGVADDATLAAMKAEGWKTVKVGFSQNDEGDYTELALFKSDDGVGVRIRDDYKNQRPNIHVSVKSLGTAKAKSNGGAFTVKREGDAFVFHIRECVNIVKD
jgi:hypothetical protein